MAYINDRNPKRLSPSVSARCEIGLDKLTHWKTTLYLPTVSTTTSANICIKTLPIGFAQKEKTAIALL